MLVRRLEPSLACVFILAYFLILQVLKVLIFFYLSTSKKPDAWSSFRLSISLSAYRFWIADRVGESAIICIIP